MPIFKKDKNKLIPIKEESIKLEKDLQKLAGKNLDTILGLKFISSEFYLHGFRIDTLAFDEESKAFAIIEYKKDKNFSVVDQGFAYLSLMLENKADFILECNEKNNKNLRKEDIDWSQSRVIFVAPFFTNYQRGAINFKDLPIELWEVNKYENNTISFQRINSSERSESINKIYKDKRAERVSREIKVYTEGDHLQKSKEEIRELYENLKERFLNLGKEVEIKPKKKYIGFISRSNFVDVLPQQNQIKLWLNLRKRELEDLKGYARDVSEIGHWGNGDYEIIVDTRTDLDYLMTLIKQAYNKKK